MPSVALEQPCKTVTNDVNLRYMSGFGKTISTDWLICMLCDQVLTPALMACRQRVSIGSAAWSVANGSEQSTGNQ